MSCEVILPAVSVGFEAAIEVNARLSIEGNMNRIYDGAGRVAANVGFGRGSAMTAEEKTAGSRFCAQVC
jgi:hypothetical protein